MNLQYPKTPQSTQHAHKSIKELKILHVIYKLYLKQNVDKSQIPGKQITKPTKYKTNSLTDYQTNREKWRKEPVIKACYEKTNKEKEARKRTDRNTGRPKHLVKSTTNLKSNNTTK